MKPDSIFSANRNPTIFLSATKRKTLDLSGHLIPTSEKPRSLSTTDRASSTFFQWLTWSPGLTQSTLPAANCPTTLSVFQAGILSLSSRPECTWLCWPSSTGSPTVYTVPQVRHNVGPNSLCPASITVWLSDKEEQRNFFPRDCRLVIKGLPSLPELAVVLLKIGKNLEEDDCIVLELLSAENDNLTSACREDSKAYLGCRMDKKLMAKEDWSKLGFSDLERKESQTKQS